MNFLLKIQKISRLQDIFSLHTHQNKTNLSSTRLVQSIFTIKY